MPRRLKRFDGKTIVVTGGSSGIGRALARMLAQRGASLLLLARRQAALEETLSLLERDRVSAEQRFASECVDVSQREAIEQHLRAFDAVRPVDVLVNCAGVAYADYFESTAPEVFEEMIRVNYLGAVWTCRALVPAFRTRGKGAIVNVASMAGAIAFLGYSAYAPSKYALIGFTEALRSELAVWGIQVSVVLPPDTRTPQLEAEARSRPPETCAIAGLARVLEPEQVAAAMIRGIEAGRFRIVPGWDAQLSDRLARHIPGVARWFLDRTAARTRRRS